MLLALQQAATSQPFINLDPAGGNDVAGAWLVWLRAYMQQR
jgi:hypothetical protein